ncbi:unnamed protein product [Zymoseptoria tritici ST99CH_3D1]|nr:unnamed protein product [Zymoseptoria tritici ST99CH_3D1]
MDHNYQPSYQSFNPYTTNYDAGRHTSNDDSNPPQYNHHASSSSRPAIDPAPSTSLNSPSFDILEWHPAYQSCQRYFLDHAQHDPGTQAVCALINIRLPFQWLGSPVTSSSQSSGAGTSAGGGGGPGQRSSSHTGVPSGSTNHAFTFSSGNGPSNMRLNPSPSRAAGPPIFVSPIPYIRRLVVTGFDKPPILHGFFGDDYVKGIMPHVECERRNYLFAAKSGGWRSCKRAYDIGSGGGVGGGAGGDETVPFMKALKDVPAEEVRAAEADWSRWLGMEDWMVGEDGPEVKREDQGDEMASAIRGGHSERMNTRLDGRHPGEEGSSRAGAGMEHYRSHS